jgi:hypothetical protein
MNLCFNQKSKEVVEDKGLLDWALKLERVKL